MPPPHFEQWPKERVFLWRSYSSLMLMSVSMSMIVSANWSEKFCCNPDVINNCKYWKGCHVSVFDSRSTSINFMSIIMYHVKNCHECLKKNHAMAITQFFVFLCTHCTCCCLCHCICFLLIRPRPGQIKTRGCPKKYANRMLLEPWCTGTTWAWKVFFCSFLTKTKQDQAPPSHIHGKI